MAGVLVVTVCIAHPVDEFKSYSILLCLKILKSTKICSLLSLVGIYCSDPLLEKRRTDTKCSEASPWKASLFFQPVRI